MRTLLIKTIATDVLTLKSHANTLMASCLSSAGMLHLGHLGESVDARNSASVTNYTSGLLTKLLLCSRLVCAPGHEVLLHSQPTSRASCQTKSVDMELLPTHYGNRVHDLRKLLQWLGLPSWATSRHTRHGAYDASAELRISLVELGATSRCDTHMMQR